MVAQRKWTQDKLQEALLSAADTSVEATAQRLGIGAQSLANAFNRYGLSVREARKALNDNEPRGITLGHGPFPVKRWPIRLAEWCRAAKQLELQPHGCRWITGDPLGEHSYCCDTTLPGKKLCKKHRKKSFLA